MAPGVELGQTAPVRAWNRSSCARQARHRPRAPQILAKGQKWRSRPVSPSVVDNHSEAQDVRMALHSLRSPREAGRRKRPLGPASRQGSSSDGGRAEPPHRPPLALPGGPCGTEVAEPAGKPGSVVDNHSSRPCLAAGLKQRTRGRAEPTHRPPIWPCSRWGLPCPATLAPQAVGSYPTVSPLPRALAGRSAVCSLLH